MHSKVLLAASTRWISTARLAMAFAEAGSEVDALCRSDHPMLQIPGVARHFTFSEVQPLKSMEQRIRESAPSLLICCDETTLRYAHAIYLRAISGWDGVLCSLLERSFGSLAALEIGLSRSRFLAMAESEGIAVPETCVVETAADLPEIGERVGWPLILKAEGSSGGNGVRVARDAEEADASWNRLHNPPGLLRAIHRVFCNGQMAPIHALLGRERLSVVAQRMVDGPEATVAVACWRGELLAAHCLEVVETWSLRGPSSVLRRIDSPEILKAACILTKRLHLSGLCGFDFILDRSTGAPMLIEMNMRPTQTSHLALGPGKDLVSALLCAQEREGPAKLLERAPAFAQQEQGGRGTVAMRVEGQRCGRPMVTDRTHIALFPQEIQRDPKSAWLTHGFHDVPWSEPALMRAATRSRWSSKYLAMTRFLVGLGSRRR